MQSDGTFKASIAFSSQVVLSNWSSPMMMAIEPTWFGGMRCQGNYVPLKPNIEGAVKASLEANSNYNLAAKAATEPTQWFVLTLTLNPNELTQAWAAGILHWSAHMTGIEWWATLQPTEIGVLEWNELTLDPIGLGSWSYTTCSNKFNRPQSKGVCGGCHAGDSSQGIPVWRSTYKYDKINYCANCWNDFVCKWESRKQQDAEMQD